MITIWQKRWSQDDKDWHWAILCWVPSNEELGLIERLLSGVEIKVIRDSTIFGIWNRELRLWWAGTNKWDYKGATQFSTREEAEVIVKDNPQFSNCIVREV